MARRALGFQLLVLAARSACEAAAGGCPSYGDVANMSNTLVSGFELSKHLGIWFEVYSHNLPVLTSGCHCTRYNNTLTEDGWADNFACKKGGPRGAVSRVSTVGHLTADSRYPGMLSETFTLPLVGPMAPTAYWVLDVEQDASGGYARELVYACTSFGSMFGLKQEWIYLFSRTPKLDTDVKERWLAYMKSKGIDVSDVRQVPQDPGCWDEIVLAKSPSVHI